MRSTHIRMTPADALVIFGATGDLAHKMIFPALYAMAKSDVLNVPVVGVAAPKWSLAQLRKRATDSIRQVGKIDDRDALDHLLNLLRYVGGDYNDPGTFTALRQALGEAMAGNGALFTREDAVEAAWAVVDPVLNTHPRALRYRPGSWGPKQADALIASDGRWHNPMP